jgi:folate-dependent phosphoribosylglycinamide formyltransferase PurN
MMRPRVVLMCHQQDRIDSLGLAWWLASTLDLVGIIQLHDGLGALLGRVQREVHRIGLLRFLDVVAFRIHYRLFHAKPDSEWIEQELRRLRSQYQARIDFVPRLVTHDANSREAVEFLDHLHPDLMIARCKTLLKPEIFDLPRHGTYALHPGICPEYRNAHGCFWALVNRDLERVGMTLLRIDRGVDTGPVLMQAGYQYDERRESPRVMQYRVVLENLDAIAKKLKSVCSGEWYPILTRGQRSATWGQPWLSAYWRWRRQVYRGAQ